METQVLSTLPETDYWTTEIQNQSKQIEELFSQTEKLEESTRKLEERTRKLEDAQIKKVNSLTNHSQQQNIIPTLGHIV